MSSNIYVKRFRMEVVLERPVAIPALPAGYRLVSWPDSTIERHALTKFRSFRDEVDSDVFPCLGDYFGCLQLMREISDQITFHEKATWLITNDSSQDDCGTIQGLANTETTGAIQNVGVTPGHRSQGLGRALVAAALNGFQLAGIQRVSLEVTAANDAAISLYRSMGFRTIRTLYRAVSDLVQEA